MLVLFLPPATWVENYSALSLARDGGTQSLQIQVAESQHCSPGSLTFCLSASSSFSLPMNMPRSVCSLGNHRECMFSQRVMQGRGENA